MSLVWLQSSKFNAIKVVGGHRSSARKIKFFLGLGGGILQNITNFLLNNGVRLV